MSATSAASVPGLLRLLLAADPGRPRLTWYGPDGDRVELSARTLDNWVAKTANLLVEEFDAGPGTRVDVRLPVHWRTATWLLATWAVGACVVVPAGTAAPVPDAASGEPPDVVVTADPAAALAAGAAPDGLVAVALPALATAFGAGLPAGALDGAAEVRTRGDVFTPLVEPAPRDEALAVAGGPSLSHRDLMPAAAAAARSAHLPAQARVLARGGAARCVEELLAPLAAGGSVVLCSPALDAATVAGIARQEQVTTTVGAA